MVQGGWGVAEVAALRRSLRGPSALKSDEYSDDLRSATASGLAVSLCRLEFAFEIRPGRSRRSATFRRGYQGSLAQPKRFGWVRRCRP